LSGTVELLNYQLFMLTRAASWIVQHWPLPRGQWRVISLFSKLFLSREESIAPIGSLQFPFQPYQWNFFFGTYEPETKLLINALVASGDVFLDVGANVGYFSAVAANAAGDHGRVIALEPEPVHYERLRRFAEINPSFNIDVLQAAMSDQRGRISFYVCDHPGWHSLIAEFPQAPITKAIEVETWSLDELLKLRGLDHFGAVKMAKVDVEGAEHLVFRGAAEAVAQHWVQAFYVEVTPSSHSKEIFSTLLAAGYQSFRWDSNARTWRPHHSNEALSLQENILWLSSRCPQLLTRIALGNG